MTNAVLAVIPKASNILFTFEHVWRKFGEDQLIEVATAIKELLDTGVIVKYEDGYYHRARKA